MRTAIAILAAALLAACTHASGVTQDIELTKQQKSDIERAVLAHLKDPESARFGSMRATLVSGAPAACGWVNARNSFGGYSGPELYYARLESGRFNVGMDHGDMADGAAALTCTMMGLTPPRS